MPHLFCLCMNVRCSSEATEHFLCFIQCATYRMSVCFIRGARCSGDFLVVILHRFKLNTSVSLPFFFFLFSYFFLYCVLLLCESPLIKSVKVISLLHHAVALMRGRMKKCDVQPITRIYFLFIFPFQSIKKSRQHSAHKKINLWYEERCLMIFFFLSRTLLSRNTSGRVKGGKRIIVILGNIASACMLKYPF